MTLTFGQAKKILAQYQGRGGKIPTEDSLNQFTIKVLQYLLLRGSPNIERVFELYAINGSFTAPYELDVPLKAKINGRVANVVSKWFEFRSGSDFNDAGCIPNNLIAEDANTYYTAYDIPAGGAKVGIVGTANELPDASIIVQGDDTTGRPVYTNHRGAQIAGEYLSIKKGVYTWSNVTFGNITGVVKTRTVGYTPFYWDNGRGRGFLSDYAPIEEVPAYRRFNINVPSCPSPAKIIILGKLRIKPVYSDNDRIPFDNLYTIELAGQQVHAQYNKDLPTAQQADGFLQSLTNNEATHKRVNNGNPIEVFYDNSAGIIKGLTSRF